MERTALELRPGASAPAALVEIYPSRFADSAIAGRLRSRLGLSGYARRPLVSYAASANTSCLFLAPQELNPLSSPLLDAFVENDQTGATRAALPERLGARVRTASGVPVPKMLVQFTALGGVVEPSSALTDPFGVAYARLTLGARSGTTRVTARTSGAHQLCFKRRLVARIRS